MIAMGKKIRLGKKKKKEAGRPIPREKEKKTKGRMENR